MEGGVASNGLYTHFCGARFLAKALHAAADMHLLCYCSIFFPACQLGFSSDESPGKGSAFWKAEQVLRMAAGVPNRKSRNES